MRFAVTATSEAMFKIHPLLKIPASFFCREAQVLFGALKRKMKNHPQNKEKPKKRGEKTTFFIFFQKKSRKHLEVSEKTSIFALAFGKEVSS